MVVSGEEYGKWDDTRERCNINETSWTIDRDIAERRLEDNIIEEIKRMIIRSEPRAILVIVSISRYLPAQDEIDRHIFSLSRRSKEIRVSCSYFSFS